MAGKARKSTKAKSSSKTALARRKSAAPPKKPKRVEVDADKNYEVAAVGPIYPTWGKRKTKNSKGKIVTEHYLKKDSKHRIWVKWINPFEDKFEENNETGNDCKWSAELQSVFEGSHMKKMVKECLDSKVVWPWVKEDGDKKTTLISKGFKEWKLPKAKKGTQPKWEVRYEVEVNTDTSGQSGTDSDGTSSTTDNAEDADEDDEV